MTGARSRVEKFNRGYIKHNGEPAQEIVDEGQGVAVMKLGTIGVTVKIIPPGAELPDDFEIHDDVDVEPVEQVAESDGVESLLAEDPEEIPDVGADDEVTVPQETPEEIIDEEVVEADPGVSSDEEEVVTEPADIGGNANDDDDVAVVSDDADSGDDAETVAEEIEELDAEVEAEAEDLVAEMEDIDEEDV